VVNVKLNQVVHGGVTVIANFAPLAAHEEQLADETFFLNES
jgi:hypothetical protein